MMSEQSLICQERARQHKSWSNVYSDSGYSKCKGPGVVFSKKIEGTSLVGTGGTEKGNRNVDR